MKYLSISRTVTLDYDVALDEYDGMTIEEARDFEVNMPNSEKIEAILSILEDKIDADDTVKFTGTVTVMDGDNEESVSDAR